MRAVSVVSLLVSASVWLGAPAAASAQQDTVAGPRLRQAFAALPEGRTVKILRASGTTVGRYSGLAGDSLALLTGDGPPTTLALDDVKAAWSRKHQAGKGAMIGGIAGVVLGGLLGAGASSVCEAEVGDCGSTAGMIIVGGLGGAAIGAGLGALIGAAIPGWKPIAPAAP